MVFKALKTFINNNNQDNNYNLLKKAVVKGNANQVNMILNNHTINLNILDEKYFSLLDQAIIKQNIDIAKILSERGANIGTVFYFSQSEKDFISHINILKNINYDLNKIDRLGFNAIHYASSLGYSEALKMLLDMNITISKVAINGKTPLKIALEKNKKGVHIGNC